MEQYINTHYFKKGCKPYTAVVGTPIHQVWRTNLPVLNVRGVARKICKSKVLLFYIAKIIFYFPE